MKKETDLIRELRKYFGEYLPNAYGASPNPVRSYKDCFRLFLSYAEKQGIRQITFGNVSKDVIVGFLDSEEKERKCSANTRNQRLAAISSFAKFASRSSMDALDFAQRVNEIPQKKHGKRQISFFSKEEVTALFRAPDRHTRIGNRDRALFVFMYATGARAQEVCDTKVKDVLFGRDGKTVVILTGKGRKTRRVAIPKEASRIISEYLDYERIGDRPEEYLFFTQTSRHMSIACIEEIYRKYIAIAKKRNPKLFQKKYTPHSMRHTTATHMLEAGIPLIVIKNFLGHVSLQTTEIYAEVSQATVDKYLMDFNEANYQGIKEANAKRDRYDFLK